MGLITELQERLVELDKKNKHTSYISDLWFDMYLKSRAPLVLNCNPFISMNDDPVMAKMDQVKYPFVGLEVHEHFIV